MTDSTSARWTRRMMATVLAVLTAVSMSIGAAQAEPTAPQQPTQPTQPADPVAPAQPTDPLAPVQPTDPAAPAQPTDPVAPVQPTDPVAPAQPTDPVAPVQPTDPAAPAQPTDPVAPVQPTDPVAPVQPTDPVQPIQPTDPLAPVPPVEGEEDEDAVQPDVPTAPGLPTTGELGFGTLPQGVDPNEPVIQLGADQTVTQQQFAMEFDRAMRSLAMQQGLPYTEQTREVFDRFRGEFLDMYATHRALILEAQNRGIEIADEDVDREIDAMRDTLGAEQFDRTLMDLGYLGVEDYRTAVREGLMAQRVADEFRGEVDFTDEDLQGYYETHQTTYFHDRTFDEARDDVESRFVSERLNEQFRTLRADHGIETFADRITWNWDQN
jgi:hypothetical protein